MINHFLPNTEEATEVLLGSEVVPVKWQPLGCGHHLGYEASGESCVLPPGRIQGYNGFMEQSGTTGWGRQDNSSKKQS